MLLSDSDIALLCDPSRDNPMISPFVPRKETPISRGLSSAGYDITLSPDVRLCTNRFLGVMDPLDDTSKFFRAAIAENPCKPGKELTQTLANGWTAIELPPHSFSLAASVEKFHIPDDVLAVCVGKSTYARVGLILNVTPLEPGWRGYLTLELSNTTPHPVRIYPGMGIGQLLFHKLTSPARNPYGKGKYQDQSGLTYAQ